MVPVQHFVPFVCGLLYKVQVNLCRGILDKAWRDR